MPGTDIATAAQDQRAKALERQRNQAAYIEKLGPSLRKVLGDEQQTERLIRIAIAAARGSELMQRATALSLAGSLMTASVLGLEPNTPAGECYLVPYQNKKAGRGPDGEFPVEAQLIVGYQGYVKLYRQSPMAGDIFAEAVYPEDQFEWAKGTSPFIDHRPKPEARAADSKPTHYYAVAILANGAKPFVVLTADEVKELRRGKEGSSGDIPDPQRWMERKTALRQLTKLLPKSFRLALAAQVDEQTGTELYAARVKAERVEVPDEAVDTGTGELLAGQVEDPPTGPGTEGL